MFKKGTIISKGGTQIIFGQGDVGLLPLELTKGKESEGVKNTIAIFRAKDGASDTLKSIVKSGNVPEQNKVVCLQFNTVSSIDMFIERLEEMKMNMLHNHEKLREMTVSTAIDTSKFSMEMSGYFIDTMYTEE